MYRKPFITEILDQSGTGRDIHIESARANGIMDRVKGYVVPAALLLALAGGVVGYVSYDEISTFIAAGVGDGLYDLGVTLPDAMDPDK